MSIMSLHLVVSNNQTAMSTYIMNDIKQQLRQQPLGKPIFYIVPEQMTFQQEYTMFTDETIKGSIRAQVVSFSRLAWRILQEVGGSTKQFISATGTQMMLRKIVTERDEPFHMFQKAIDKVGFLEELDQLITEFKRHQIMPEQLKEQLNYTSEQKSLHYKLTDVHYIYEKLTTLLKDHYIDGEDQLQLLIDAISSASLLQGAQIYIDGFHRFTPQELAIVCELLRVAEHVTVTLTGTETDMKTELDELDLFYQTKETYMTLQSMASELRVSIGDTIFLTDD